MATMQAGSLSLDKKGNLSISFPGKTFQVVEVQPGLLRDRDDPNTTMVLKTDTSGQAYLIFTGPNFTYIKIPWYESIDFINILIYLSLVLFVYAITIWIIDGIKWLRKRPPASIPQMNTILSRLARWTAGLFGGLIIFVIICMQVGLTTVDPNLGVPEYTFGSPLLVFSFTCIDVPPVYFRNIDGNFHCRHLDTQFMEPWLASVLQLADLYRPYQCYGCILSGGYIFRCHKILTLFINMSSRG